MLHCSPSNDPLTTGLKSGWTMECIFPFYSALWVPLASLGNVKKSFRNEVEKSVYFCDLNG